MFKLELNDPNFIEKASEEMNLFFLKGEEVMLWY